MFSTAGKCVWSCGTSMTDIPTKSSTFAAKQKSTCPYQHQWTCVPSSPPAIGEVPLYISPHDVRFEQMVSFTVNTMFSISMLSIWPIQYCALVLNHRSTRLWTMCDPRHLSLSVAEAHVKQLTRVCMHTNTPHKYTEMHTTHRHKYTSQLHKYTSTSHTQNVSHFTSKSNFIIHTYIRRMSHFNGWNKDVSS